MPSHPDRVRRNYVWFCHMCFEKFDSKEKLDKHLEEQTVILDVNSDGPVKSNMHWSGLNK